VQNLVDLDRWPANEKPRFGQVKLTIAQFFLPGGSSTQNKGVVPDIAFPVTVDATEFGESTNDNALPWTRIAAVPHVRYGNFTPMLAKLDALHDARVAKNKEFQWWSEDVARFREQREKGYVSLNEAERRAERDADQARRNERQAQRKELGLKLDPLAADANDDGLQANERDVVVDAAREKAAEDRPDPLLREAATILADATAMLSGDKQLAATVLPETGRATHWAE
jgi:carboxyl-terminal processing protease